MRHYLLLFFSLFTFLIGFAQIQNEKFLVRGYVKDLRIANYTKPTGIIQDNFLHNRLNLRYFANERFTFALEMRNRFFYGETVKLNPFYANQVHQDDGMVNTSILWVDEPSFFLHSIFDRVYVRYTDNNWDITLGRQRVNWGIGSVWNPNDLFNSFNFSDFDYEERPGSDAIRVQRYLKGGMNAIELVASPDTGKDKSVYAGMYSFNKWNYDIQILGGIYKADAALGIGWAGNLKNAGFKGEATYFQPKQNWDTSGVLSATAGLDYSFRNGLYVSGAFLYNSAGVSNAAALINPDLFANSLSPKTLMPSEWSMFAQSNYSFSPLFSGSAAIIYAPGINILFTMPSISYSLSTNIELLVLGQLYYGEYAGDFNFLGSGMFLRTKFSF